MIYTQQKGSAQNKEENKNENNLQTGQQKNFKKPHELIGAKLVARITKSAWCDFTEDPNIENSI